MIRVGDHQGRSVATALQKLFKQQAFFVCTCRRSVGLHNPARRNFPSQHLLICPISRHHHLFGKAFLQELHSLVNAFNAAIKTYNDVGFSRDICRRQPTANVQVKRIDTRTQEGCEQEKTNDRFFQYG
jgi:hypothetical protein